jgi:hypothetical protein
MRERILKNAAEVARLHRRVHETFKLRTRDSEKWNEWKRACAEFHAGYDTLAFPGGYRGALDRIVSGDEEAMEAAVCFLECRPYFFRSGYMFKDILRKCRKAPLSVRQAERLKTIEGKIAEWRRKKEIKERTM